LEQVAVLGASESGLEGVAFPEMNSLENLKMRTSKDNAVVLRKREVLLPRVSLQAAWDQRQRLGVLGERGRRDELEGLQFASPPE